MLKLSASCLIEAVEVKSVQNLHFLLSQQLHFVVNVVWERFNVAVVGRHDAFARVLGGRVGAADVLLHVGVDAVAVELNHLVISNAAEFFELEILLMLIHKLYWFLLVNALI